MVRSQERVEREAKRRRGQGGFSGAPFVGQFQHGSSTSYIGTRGSLQFLPPTPGSGFECGKFRNIWRQCPRHHGGLSQQRSQPSTSAPVTSPPAKSARGGGQSSRGRPRRGGQAHFYALPTRLDAIASDVVITCSVSVCYRDASILFDPDSTYSYVSSYFAHFLDMPHESLVLFVHVSTPVGDIIVVDRVYRSCVVTIGGLETQVDLLLLSMVDFDVILGMEWISLCHSVLDCHAKTMTLSMLGFSRVEWSGFIDYVPSRVISYLNEQRMGEKGCLSYLAFVRDVRVETPTIDSIPVVRYVLDVFPAYLPCMPLDRDIDFGIDLVPGT
ncbi:uncharacterized protein [Nicotiana tomentosiformis]|uniref:uncharacterized protein n=1 Tax=Nicotiana tomentosiformis TaxID=4098 RepID=UPI00388C8797